MLNTKVIKFSNLNFLFFTDIVQELFRHTVYVCHVILVMPYQGARNQHFSNDSITLLQTLISTVQISDQSKSYQ
jgi:hypothetical protein